MGSQWKPPTFANRAARGATRTCLRALPRHPTPWFVQDASKVAKDGSKRISGSPRWPPRWLQIAQDRSSGFQHAPKGSPDRSKTGPSAMLCDATLRNAMLCNAMQCYAMLRNAMRCYRVHSYAMLRNAMQCYLLLLLRFRSSEVSPFRFSVLGGLSFSISRSSEVSPFRFSVRGGLSFLVSRSSGVSPFRFLGPRRSLLFDFSVLGGFSFSFSQSSEVSPFRFLGPREEVDLTMVMLAHVNPMQSIYDGLDGLHAHAPLVEGDRCMGWWRWRVGAQGVGKVVGDGTGQDCRPTMCTHANECK